MKHRQRRLVVPLVIAMLIVAGCSRHEPPASAAPQPAQVESIEGSDLNRVTLTDSSMRQLGIQTTAVKAAPPAAGIPSALSIIPVTAIIYDPQGKSWAYTVVDARTFTRKAIVIDHIDGANAILRSGPPVGSPVVTVGASELLGAEYGVGEE